jgi:phage terminase large subunit-like protein
MLALRAGTNPQALITTTPRRHVVLKRILAEPTTVQTNDTTYANQAHLPREFLTQIAALYENTRFGRQEIYAEFLDTIELLLDAGNLTMHPRCTRLKEAFRSYRRQRRGGQWIDFPADGHPEEDLIDALRGGVRDALPEGNAMAP